MTDEGEIKAISRKNKDREKTTAMGREQGKTAEGRRGLELSRRGWDEAGIQEVLLIGPGYQS